MTRKISVFFPGKTLQFYTNQLAIEPFLERNGAHPQHIALPTKGLDILAHLDKKIMRIFNKGEKFQFFPVGRTKSVTYKNTEVFGLKLESELDPNVKLTRSC